MDGLSKALAGIPPQNIIPRTERPSGNQPHKEPMQIRIEDIEGGINLYKTPIGPIGSVRELDGTVNIRTQLLDEAYQILKDAGYSDDELVFDIGKKPSKYKDSDNLLPFEYKFDSAENLLNSIFDRLYRSIEYPEHNYTKIVVHLEPPTAKTQVETPLAPPAIDEGRMKVGDILYPGKKNYGPVEEPAYDVTLSSRAGVPNVEWSMEGVEVELKTNEFRFDADFEVIKTEDILARMEADREKADLSIKMISLELAYRSDAWKAWDRAFMAATRYAATDRQKFLELADAAQEEYDETLKPLLELHKKLVEDGDVNAFINSKLFDPYRKRVFGEETE